MSPGSGPDPTAVLVAAAGASWEAQALDRLERGHGVVLTKRCVDLADSVASLRRSGLGVVVVAAPEELLDGDAERLRRLGIDHLLASTELDSLAGTVADAGSHARSDAGPDAGPETGRRGGSPPGPTTEEPGSASGRLVAVWGPTGAPGRTTVAVGLASEIAVAGQETLLVDADGYGGAVAQHLGVLDEVSGLLAAARAANAGRLDGDRIAAIARQVDDRLRVLTGLPRPDRWSEVRPAAFDRILDRAAELASYTVLDLGFSLEGEPPDPFGPAAPQRNLMTLAGLERADEVVVVGAADPVGLARLARGIVELREVLPAVRPRVVVNRTRPSLGWSDREIRGMVEGFVTPLDVHFLPEDRVAADRALMAGRSLAETGDSSLRSALRDVAAAVLGDPVGAVPRRGARRRARRRR